MALDSRDIHRLCELARLAIDEDEIADVSKKLSGIVGLVDQLQAVDTADVRALAHPLDEPQRLRSDEVTENDEHKRFQANAPSVERDLYLVPKVLE